MKKYLLIISLLLTGCKNNISSSLRENSISNSNNIIDYYLIDLKDMYNIDDNKYIVYFYTNTCPACNDMKKNLISYLNNENKILNIYIVNLFYTDDESYNKLIKDFESPKEEIVNKTKGATSISATYFVCTPSLYFIEKIENTNTLVDLYVSYQKIQDFFINNKISIE